jgi:hypothetical protein
MDGSFVTALDSRPRSRTRSPSNMSSAPERRLGASARWRAPPNAGPACADHACADHADLASSGSSCLRCDLVLQHRTLACEPIGEHSHEHS